MTGLNITFLLKLIFSQYIFKGNVYQTERWRDAAVPGGQGVPGDKAPHACNGVLLGRTAPAGLRPLRPLDLQQHSTGAGLQGAYAPLSARRGLLRPAGHSRPALHLKGKRL